VVPPKTRKGKRMLEKREPQLVENTKMAALLRGHTASGMVSDVMKDLTALRKTSSTFYGRKHDLRPFEDIVAVENFCKKIDCSVFAVGNHSKKRPHNITLGRLYNHHLLDMVELGVEDYVSMAEFPAEARVALGTKPLVCFTGEPFVADVEWQGVRNILLDYLRGEDVSTVRLQGLELMIQVTAVDGKLLVRCYKVLLKKSGGRVPRVELSECGPRIDFRLKRTKLASDDLMRVACRQPKENLMKKKKNIEKNALGSTLGRVHMDKQDLDKIQTRRMRALKRSSQKELHGEGKSGGEEDTETEEQSKLNEEEQTEVVHSSEVVKQPLKKRGKFSKNNKKGQEISKQNMRDATALSMG